jgi:hypothetical protein
MDDSTGLLVLMIQALGHLYRRPVSGHCLGDHRSHRRILRVIEPFKALTVSLTLLWERRITSED